MSTNNLEFPRGLGANVTSSSQPYMLLTSYESKSAIESTGQQGHAGNKDYNPGIAKSSIALYIPPNALKTAFVAEYGNAEGGATKAAMATAWAKGDTLDFIWAGIKGGGQTMKEKAMKQIDKGTGMLAAQGIAVNNHLALTYKGPSQFRTHDFSFAFFPKNKPEADEIQKILKDLENGMLPRMGGGSTKIKGRTLSSPYFQSPRHWTIDFFKGDGVRNDYLFKIRKSVITTMSINHDQQSTVSLHKDGEPVQTTLNLTFQEIELPISEDIGTDISEQIEKAIIQADNAEKERKKKRINPKTGKPNP